MKHNRIISLECARGLASIFVVFHHFLLAFSPATKGFFWSGGLKWTPLYFLVNGNGAVTFFFVLSGFVLTIGLFRNPSMEVLATSIIKRLPRLMIPAGASILLGFLVLEYTHAQYLAASAYSGSQWLRDFGGAIFPDNFVPSLLDAARQSLFVFIFQNKAYYNSNLWTMFNEFYGSMLVFMIVLLYWFSFLRTKAAMFSVHFALAITFAFIHPAFVPFVAGSFLAYLAAGVGVEFKVSAKSTLVLLAGAVFGFASDWWPANTLASIFVILSLLGNRALSAHLSGRVGSIVGALSFPLYLVHTLVIVSLSSLVYARLLSFGFSLGVVLCLTLLVTALASVLASLPFVVLDSAWVSWLNKRMRSIVSGVAAACRIFLTRESLRQE